MRWVSVQEEDFNVQHEYDAICNTNVEDGAVVFFVGRVRDINKGDEIYNLTLEHYPGMTEKSLHRIIDQACQQWQLNRVRVIHRVGTMTPSDQIVFVAVSSPHRQDSFSGAEFIMDYLKTEAPFWKKEETGHGKRWVSSRDSDNEKVKQWQSNQ